MRSAPVLYVDNKAMLALCREQRLEHRTKHIALRYFLARELQQHGQLRLAYVASEANTADVFTKALAPCDHQRFCTQLACFALPYLTGLVTPSSPPLCLWGGGSGGGSGGFSGSGGGTGGSGGSGGSGSGGNQGGAVQRAAVGVVAVEAVGLEAVGLDLGMEALVVASGSSSSVGARPLCPSSFAEQLRSGVAIFDLDYDAILAAMYALSVIAAGDCYLCVPPEPGIEAASLGASGSALPGTAPAEVLHTFTLDSGASRCFIRDNTTLTPLSAPVPVRLVDPSGGPVLARSSTVLPCPAVLSGSLSGLHLPLFSTNLVFVSGLVAPPCSCRLLSHQTLLWHHRLGHPSLPRLRGMHSRLLVSSLPRSLPPLPPSPALPCLPCVEGQQRAAPHSSSFPPTTAPLQTLHMDVKGEVPDVLIPWIRAVRLQLRERFRQDLLVLRLHSDRGGEFSSDLLRDLCRWEGILQSFTLLASPQHNGIAERRIGLVMEVARTSMIHAPAPHFMWPFAVRYAAHQLNLWPRVSLPEASPTLRWMGKVGDALVFRVWGSRAFVRDTSADKLSARAVPCVFLGFPPDTPGLQFYHPTSRRVLLCQDVTFDESVPFYRVSQEDPVEPVEVAVNSGAAGGGSTRGSESRGAKPAGAGPGGTERACTEPKVAESEGAERGGAELGGAETERAEPGGAEPECTEPGGTLSTGGPPGALSWREPLSPPQLHEWFAQHTRLRSGAAGARGFAARGTGATGAGAGGAVGVLAGGTGAGATRGTGVGAAGVTGAAGPGGACTRGTGGAGAVGAAGVRAGDPGARDTRAGGAGPGGAGAVGASSGDTGRPRPFFVPLLQLVLGLSSSTGLTPPLLCPPLDQSQPPLQPASPLPAPSPYTEQTGGLIERCEPVSCHASCVRAVRSGRRVPRQRPPPVPGTHHMALHPSSVPRRVPLPFPPASSLADGPDPESDLVRAAGPTVPRLLATVVTDPSFESANASALVAELVDFAAACRLDYANRLVAESKSDCPPSVGSESALGTDILEDRQEDFEHPDPALLHRGDYGSLLLSVGVDFFQTFSPTLKMTTLWVLLHVAAQHDYELHSLDFSTDFLLGSLHEEIWLRRPPGFTGSFPASTQWSLRRPVYGLRQAPREWHDTLRTTLAALGFAPSTTDPSLFLPTYTSLPPFYILVYVDDFVFAIAETEALALVKSKLQKRHTSTNLGELRSYLGLQITRDRVRRTITLTQSHMVHQVLQRFGFRYSSPQSTPLPTGHSLSAPPSNESIELSGPYPELVGCLRYLMTCTRPDLAYPLSILARYIPPGRHRPEHWEGAKRVLRYLCSTSGMGLVLGRRGPVVLTGHADASWVDDLATQWSSSCEAEIYAGAMAAQELRWLTYLLTDLGERPGSSPVLYVDNKAMIALCQEHRLEHRTKHITLRYFLARVLQQRGQLRLAYVATRANTADIFTKALQSGDHQHFCIVLGLVPSLRRLLTA
ncbi:unnamed protein product [Closterium sp. NIES-53]